MCVCRSFLTWRRFVFFLSSCSIVEPLACVCFCASSCGTCCFPQRVLPQVTLRRLRNLSSSSCLSCSCGGAMSVGFAVSLVWGAWFSTLCHALPPTPAVLRGLPCRRLPFGVSAFSDPVCLTYCCAVGLGWAATLTLCSLCFSSTGWLARVCWILHPVTGSSHGGCDYSLCGSMVVPYGSPCR